MPEPNGDGLHERTLLAARHLERGFTLFELSMVLVIIGLIVGGVLAGRALIRTAEMNALISQIQRYQAAVNTFRTKYDNQLPGDIDQRQAGVFGLFQCTWGGHCGSQFSALGDSVENGDAKIYMGYTQGWYSGGVCGGECAMFWRHLSEAHMIEGGYGADLDFRGEPVSQNSSGAFVLSRYQPAAKYGTAYAAVASLSYSANYHTLSTDNAFYFLTQGTAGQAPYAPMMSPADAYAIDQKIDDGKPTTGNFRVEGWGQANTGISYWSDVAATGACAYNITNIYDTSTYAAGLYNTSPTTGANVVSCIPLFIMH